MAKFTLNEYAPDDPIFQNSFAYVPVSRPSNATIVDDKTGETQASSPSAQQGITKEEVAKMDPETREELRAGLRRALGYARKNEKERKAILAKVERAGFKTLGDQGDKEWIED